MKINAESLSVYLKVTSENIDDHCKQPPDLMHMVNQMDEIFQNEIFAHEYDVSVIAGFLAMNSYTILLSAIRQGLSGHTVTIFPLVRTALESACYAYLIAHDKELEGMWLNRNKSNSALEKCRKNLTVQKAKTRLMFLSPEMANFVKQLYDESIDHGAHPNRKAVFKHLSNNGEVVEEFHSFTLNGVYGANSWNVNYSLLVCTEYGQAIAFLLAACARKHPLIHDRIEVFQNWLDKRAQIAEELNGVEIDYGV
ncbi:hypothetical protein [Pantoea sp. Ft+CA_17]|uniref:hypothetical protein n=1 Tax=Pantoea sp. Ft+CA_17 TaxID=2929508 RepID=UPI002117A1B8|nr:hypothetical protein [Pantoea sp. Ft+CA_17]